MKFSKFGNFRNKKYMKLINGEGPNKSGGVGRIFFQKKIKRGGRLFET